MNACGSQVHYHAGTQGPATPFCGKSERSFLCGDGSSVILSRDGWIELVDEEVSRTVSASSLKWSRDLDGVTWIASAFGLDVR